MNEEELKLAIKSAFDDSGFKAADADTKKLKASADGMGAAFSKAGKVAAIGIAAFTVAAGAAVVGAMSLVRSAEELGDAQARVSIVYGDAAAEVNAAAASNANALGLTKTAYLDSVGAMGQYVTQMGVNKDAAADMAMGLTELGPKVAAYANAEKEAVDSAFESAMAGKTKALEKMIGPLDEIPKGLEGAAKAQFLYQQIVEKSANAEKAWIDNQGDTDVSLSRLSATLENVKAKAGGMIAEAVGPWLQTAAGYAEELSAAFDVGGLDAVAAKLDELTGYDVSGWLATAREKWDELTVAAKDFYDNQLVPFAGFLTGTVAPAVVSLGKFLLDHKGIIIAVAVAYAALKTAMAINKAVESASAAISAAKAAWIAYRAGTQGATLATTSFGTALKLALGPIGWIAIAVGALYVAWKTNFGGIQEKTAAVVNWIKGVPAMVEAAWGQVKLGLALLVTDFKAKFAAIPDGVRTAFKVLLMILFPLPMLFTKTGRDMVAGLWNGLKAGWDAMVGWVTGKAKALASGVKKVLGISSPSRVFYEIGSWIMEGWALGMAAGGVWVVRTARQVMDDTLAEFHAADAAAVAGGVVAAMAKAAVDAALAADGVIKGKRESASEAWGRYYDEIASREDALHEQKMADLDALAKAENTAHDAARKQAIERIELQKRYIEGLLQQQRESEQKNGGGGGGAPSGLKNFNNEMDLVEAKMADLLKMIGFEGAAAMTDFWRAFHDGGQREIETAEELAEVLSALAEAVGKRYDEIGDELEKAQENRMIGEEARHKEVMRLLNERKALIDALIQAQADADADLADLIAARDALLRQAREAIAAAQKAAETAEDRIHAGVMANIAEARKAEERAHKGRLIRFEDERKAIDAAHERRMAQLQAQRDKITAGFTERQRQIEKDRTALSQLKLDLGVEDALIKLTGLEQKLNDLQAIMDSFKVVSRGREALDEQRRAITERVKITTDAQRKALQDVLDSGTLNAKDQRRVELLLLGRGTQKAEDVKRILGAGADVLKGEIAAAQMIVDYNTQQVAIRERLIEQAETQLRIDQENAQVQIDALDKRIAAEDERYKKESANLAARMTAEQQAFDDTMAWYDAISDAEDERHAKRMGDIAAEYALELAKLGMTQSEIDAMVAAARSESERIARETEETWKRIRDAMGLPGVGAVGGGTSTPTQPIPIIGGGGEIRGLRPQGGGAVEGVTITGEVSAKDATIQNVEFGGLTMNTALTFRIGAKDIAAEIVDAVIGDTALVDKLGARINARTGPRIGGSTP